MGVVVRRYRDFLILPIPTPLVSVLYCSSIPTFCSLKKKVFCSCSSIYFFVIKFYVLKNFFTQYEHTYGRLRASHSSYMKASHNSLYEEAHLTYKCTFHILRWTSAVLFQGVWCRSRSRWRALYRDASRAAYVRGPPPSRGGDLELEGGVNVSL